MAKTLEVLDGVEVSVETGTGILTALDTTKRNWGVSFTADHVRLQKPVNGWVDPGANGDNALAAIVTEVHAKALRVAYRIVIKRKNDQRQDVPLSEIGNFDRIRDVVDVVPIGDASGPPPGWTSNPPAGAAPAPQPDEAPAGAAPPQGSQEPLDDVPPPSDADAPPAAAPGRVRDGKRGPRIEEAKPWEPYNTDGSLNLGSYAVGAAEGVVLLAHDLLLERARYLAKSDGIPMADPPKGQLLALARRLLEAADRIQASARSDGHFDRMDTSHTRARAAMRVALEAHPVPWGEAPDVQAAWQCSLVEYGARLMSVVLELIDPTPGATP